MMMSSLKNVTETVAVLALVTVWHGALASAAGVIGVDGSPLSGAFDPTKCRIDRADDQFKSNEIGGQCARCITNDQCRHAYGGFGWYCCPFMKRCVNSGSMGCYDTAFCKPRCFGEKYPELKKECSGCDSSFPDNWIKGCNRDDWPALVQGRGGPAPAQQPEARPAPQPVARPQQSPNNNQGGGNGGSVPDWCVWCLEDELPTEDCQDYKNSYNWCAAGHNLTMRAKCSRTCGYCDGCPADTAALNQQNLDNRPTMKPTPFAGVGPKCKPDRKFDSDTEFSTSCGRWAKKGLCDSYPDLMHRDCADSCGFCEHPGRDENQARKQILAPGHGLDYANNNNGGRGDYESESSEEPAVRPGGKGNNGNGAGQPGQGVCAQIGNDGAACQAKASCEWDWGQMVCVALEGSCARIGANGRACSADPKCEWSWDRNTCLDRPGAAGAVLGKCERIGANGQECMSTEGCKWDWDAMSCVENAGVAPAVTPGNGSNNNRGRDRGGNKGRRQAGGGDAANLCAALRGNKCSRNSACYLDGKVCRAKVAQGGGGDACAQRSKRSCTGSCAYNKASRRCMSL